MDSIPKFKFRKSFPEFQIQITHPCISRTDRTKNRIFKIQILLLKRSPILKVTAGFNCCSNVYITAGISKYSLVLDTYNSTPYSLQWPPLHLNLSVINVMVIMRLTLVLIIRTNDNTVEVIIQSLHLNHQTSPVY